MKNVFAVQYQETSVKSYLVDWFEDEIIVNDPTGETNYQTGDKIGVVLRSKKTPSTSSLLIYTAPPAQEKELPLRYPKIEDLEDRRWNPNFEDDEDLASVPPAGITPLESPKPHYIETKSYKAEIIKVYSAEYMGAKSRSYQVRWENFEFIVTDSSGLSKFKRGKTISIEMHIENYISRGGVKHSVFYTLGGRYAPSWSQKSKIRGPRLEPSRQIEDAQRLFEKESRRLDSIYK